MAGPWVGRPPRLCGEEGVARRRSATSSTVRIEDGDGAASGLLVGRGWRRRGTERRSGSGRRRGAVVARGESEAAVEAGAESGAGLRRGEGNLGED